MTAPQLRPEPHAIRWAGRATGAAGAGKGLVDALSPSSRKRIDKSEKPAGTRWALSLEAGKQQGRHVPSQRPRTPVEPLASWILGSSASDGTLTIGRRLPATFAAFFVRNRTRSLPSRRSEALNNGIFRRFRETSAP